MTATLISFNFYFYQLFHVSFASNSSGFALGRVPLFDRTVDKL